MHAHAACMQAMGVNAHVVSLLSQVGNFEYDAEEREVRRLMEKYGEVVSGLRASRISACAACGLPPCMHSRVVHAGAVMEMGSATTNAPVVPNDPGSDASHGST
jgi:hypothetical protein